MVGENTKSQEVRVELEVEVDSLETLKKLFGRCEPQARHVLDGCSVELIDVEEGVGFAGATTATLLVSFALGVGAGLVANALYDAIGAGLRRLMVDKRRVRPTREELDQALKTVQLLASDRNNTNPEGGEDPEGEED